MAATLNIFGAAHDLGGVSMGQVQDEGRGAYRLPWGDGETLATLYDRLVWAQPAILTNEVVGTYFGSPSVGLQFITRARQEPGLLRQMFARYFHLREVEFIFRVSDQVLSAINRSPQAGELRRYYGAIIDAAASFPQPRSGWIRLTSPNRREIALHFPNPQG